VSLFAWALSFDSDYVEAIRIVNNSKVLLDKTIEGDAQAFAEALSAAGKGYADVDSLCVQYSRDDRRTQAESAHGRGIAANRDQTIFQCDGQIPDVQ
jgi:hypothetical protein